MSRPATLSLPALLPRASVGRIAVITRSTAVSPAAAATPAASALGRGDFPPFWEDQPQNWFEVFEGICYSHGITEPKALYYKLVASLPASISRRLDGVYSQAMASEENPYKYTKSEILARLQPDVLARVARMVQGP